MASVAARGLASPLRLRSARLPPGRSARIKRSTTMKRVKGLPCGGAVLALLLGACSLAPPLKTPVVPTADAYKEIGQWTQAQPADRLPRDSWWTLYGTE